MVALAFFSALILTSAVSSVLFCFAFYFLSRIYGYFLISINNPYSTTKGSKIAYIAEKTLEFIGIFFPRFDMFSKSEWLIYGVTDCFVICFWFYTHKIIPYLGIVPEVPTVNQTKIMALGDEQFFFRYLALYIQNSGDTFGRFTSLKNYDYSALLKWFLLLDELDHRSNFVPAIASYYYSNTQKVEDNKYIIEYLEKTYDKDPVNKWWWLGQAVMLAQNKLQDKHLALRLAYKLSTTPNDKLPRWAQQMPVFILEQLGEKEQALAIIKDLADKFDNYSQGEINFMNYFIRNRLGFLNEEIKKTPNWNIHMSKAAEKFFLSNCEFLIGAYKPSDFPLNKLPEFAFIGRSNVGKSSLINALVNRGNIARVSNTPGRTQQINFFHLAHRIHLVDLPGYGYAKASKQDVERWNHLIMNYLKNRSQLKRIFLLIDARHGLKPNDMAMIDFLNNFGTLVQIILTKVDKLSSKELENIIQKIQEDITNIAVCYHNVIPTSTVKKTGINGLKQEIYDIIK
ncbi:GTPase [Reticulomyxa filosa]|uniref:GTPase n=1 Tax=Reticulomyxa filosa TaxID=46433 RepID=X6LAY5_RETFI|nr:GTPase [Reticulomyxa filosa]|eukprot:ETN98296.1 GTPase [Reticulomyxa filosa]